MKIFLSWSGDRSKSLGMALRDWLPLVLHYAKPWLSERDIAAGDRWALEVGKGLEDAGYGIICLTRENLSAPWLLFEAGALSKFLETSAVCPYLLDLDFSEITGPLSQFQAKKAERGATLEMIQAINARVVEPIGDLRLTELFDMAWPTLEKRLQQIPAPSTTKKVVRNQPEILEDLVVSVRGMEQRFRKLESKMSHEVSIRTLRDLRSARRSAVQVSVVSDEDIGRTLKGDAFVIPVRGTNLVKDIAIYVGIDSDAFGSEWYLADHYSRKRLSRDECENILLHFGDSTPILRLTKTPF